MKSDNHISEHVQRDLYDAFELYYSLTFGFLDLEQITDVKVHDLSKKIKNEISQESGKFYELFEEIGKIEEYAFNLECDAKKYDKSFDPDESMSVQLRSLYQEAIREISKLIFTYGVAYGKNLESYLNSFP